MSLRIARLGGRALCEDLGRPGHAHLGITGSGAADRASLRRANALVGNRPGAAGIEIVGTLEVWAEAGVMIALAGAQTRAATVLAAGERMSVPFPQRGLRTYLAVRGGLATARTLGSAATDTLSGLGPAPLRAGDVLAVGRDLGDLRTVGDGAGDGAGATDGAGDDTAGGTPLPGPLLMLSVHPGPRADWAEDLGVLFAGEYRVGEESDRVGTRLAGAPLARARAGDAGELPSEGLVRGSVQLPPSGLPVIFGADHPVTGGYPVIAVLTGAAADALAQARPGQAVRFRRTGAW
ncbi:biotin-dependent carboxyltransferase family protein [Pseudactinotalea sp. HY158]|uniref:5-oxoprolinase subunit C family protein n=1 Tax=Pseudactinotalea sp. HY158 TaxID=2654547 RepID=UPI00129CA22B|nr:biotin-dependent carboxyltransferase family protein [Pseudactinotalea sp. HY158]QGH68926.1 allophanate hydrolase subunit 2 family protein [Pseudactinotalea sp. HY158]